LASAPIFLGPEKEIRRSASARSALGQEINWCRFCVDINSATLSKRAGSMDKVEQLEQWRESDLFDARERAVLAYTEAMTYSEQQVDEDLIEGLKAFFDDDAIVELTGLIAFQNLSSKFNAALDVPPQGFCKISSAPSGEDRT
jgi:alkylhydroperoxidase family enzyme